MPKKFNGKSQKITVVIPCFNDHKQIESIIEEIKKSKKIDEIIVVDDGSESKTKSVLSKIKNINLITHQKNTGKSKALLTGVEAAKTENILFIDADLKNLKEAHVNSLISTFFEKNSDMTLGLRKEHPLFMWLGFSQAYTGERVIKKSILIKNIELFENDGYLIEPAINKLFFHKHVVTGVKFKELTQTFKVEKRGLIGLFQDIQMQINFLEYLGPKELFFQMKFAKKL